MMENGISLVRNHVSLRTRIKTNLLGLTWSSKSGDLQVYIDGSRKAAENFGQDAKLSN